MLLAAASMLGWTLRRRYRERFARERADQVAYETTISALSQ
jgi:hypothetical protein